MKDCASKCLDLEQCDGFAPGKQYTEVPQLVPEMDLTESSFLLHDSDARLVLSYDIMPFAEEVFPNDFNIEYDIGHVQGNDTTYKYFRRSSTIFLVW